MIQVLFNLGLIDVILPWPVGLPVCHFATTCLCLTLCRDWAFSDMALGVRRSVVFVAV